MHGHYYKASFRCTRQGYSKQAESKNIEDPVHPCAGVDDIGCLVSSPDASVQYEDVKILNLHFHANSEHTLTGKEPTQLFITSYSCSGLI